WLPDAMTGPASVSALIHAATMVKAGVFLTGRMGPVFFIALSQFNQVPQFFGVIAWIGAFTALLAASQAAVAREIKKVLAYSTVSQIGYMMLALGMAGLSANFLAGYTAGLFHLLSHAVFKASLFLAAGWVLHVAESRFMDEMGGLAKAMKFTSASMLLAGLSLMGIPLFSGFWTKDAILSLSFLGGQYILLLSVSTVVAAVGGAIAYLIYFQKDYVFKTGMNPIQRFLYKRWYLDAIYYRVFVTGLLAASRGLYRYVEQGIWNRLNNTIGRDIMDYSRASDQLDTQVVDRAANEVASYGSRLSNLLR